MGSYVFVQRFLLFAADVLLFLFKKFTLQLFYFTILSDIISPSLSCRPDLRCVVEPYCVT